MGRQCVAFRFHRNGCICEGLRHGNELYGLVHELQKNLRFQDYQLTCALPAREIPCLMTTSARRCAVWVPRRSPVYSILAQASPTLLHCLITLHVHSYKLHGGGEPHGRAALASDGLSSGPASLVSASLVPASPVPRESPSASDPNSTAMETISPARSRKLFGRVARRQLG